MATGRTAAASGSVTSDNPADVEAIGKILKVQAGSIEVTLPEAPVHA